MNAPAAIESWLAGRPEPDPDPARSVRELARRGLAGPPTLPLPGAGSTAARFAGLAAIASHDLALARLAEGHADAVAILAEAAAEPPPPPDLLLGVWAAGPPGDVVAEPSPSGYRLTGKRRWCSGAGQLSHALVTAALAGEEASDGAALFLVPLQEGGVEVDRESWRAVGMARTDTFDVSFDALQLEGEALVGPPGWYLRRPGFWQGGAGVAACWWGGARGVAAPLEMRASQGGDAHLRAAHGYVSAQLFSMRASLEAVAAAFDEDPADAGARAGRLAQLVRTVVERGCGEVLRLVGEALGAGPLCHDAAHAQKVADLTVYLRQHHGPRDAAALSEELTRAGGPQ